MEAGLLHVLCGDSAAGSLRSAKVCNADEIVVQHDVLSCGPLKQFATLPEWRRLRENFWSSICDHPLYCNQPHDLTDNAHKLSGAPGVVLWMGVGLSDQLLLPSTLYIAELVAADLPILSTIEFTRHPGSKGDVIGMGELAPGEIAEHPEPRQVSARGMTELRRVWTALTAPNPAGLVEYLAESDVAFPRLQRSLGELVRRFPEVGTGLGDWDMELLRNSLEAGPDSIRIVAQTIISQSGRLDPVGDTYLFWRLRRLANPRLPYPPLRLRGEASAGTRFEVEVTPAGVDILEGRRNFVHLNGIDEWIAGIHLQSSQNRVWSRHGDALIRPSE